MPINRQIDGAAGASAFDVVIKLAERCNLACPYCYYFEKSYNADDKRALIDPQVIDALPAFLNKSVEQLNIDHFSFGFHGGEPLLLPKKRFRALCGGIKGALDGRCSFVMRVQTNGVLIDQEWVDIFAEYDIQVGLSIDGPKELHDRHRPDHKGRGSYDDTIRGFELLRSAYRAGRLTTPPGAIAVVNPMDNMSELLRHLIEDLEITSPNLNYPRGGHDEQDVVDWLTHMEKYREIVHAYLDQYVYPRFHFVRGLSEILLSLKSEQGAVVADHKNARRHSIATISSEGDIYVDDNILSVHDSFKVTGLNIFDHTLRDLVCSPLYIELTEALDSPPAKCQQCKWLRSCNGGELYNRFSASERFGSHSIVCDLEVMLREECANWLIENGAMTSSCLDTILSAPKSVSADEIRRDLLRA